MSQSMTLVYLDDGVHLSIRPDAWPKPTLDEAQAFLSLKRVTDIQLDNLKAAVGSVAGDMLVAPPQQEYLLPETLEITISRDGMTAEAEYIKGDDGGPRLSVNDALELAAQAGVTEGVDREALLYRLEGRQYGAFVLARGQSAVNGENGRIELKFNTEHDAAPKLLEADKVDFYALDLFDTVNAGDTVAVRIPAREGVPGFTVTGRALPAKNGREVTLPKGKNTYISEDGLALIASVPGRVDMNGSKVDVSNIYDVKDNVDLLTGNIDFPGDVVVRGNVIAGMKIRATGNITVYGVVESAELTSDKDIVLFQGMQGMDKGVLRAKGSITAKFLERAFAYAGQTVMVDALMHCSVESDYEVRAAGKRGVILGGSVRAGRLVHAIVVGAPSTTLTLVEVGVLPSQRQRLKELGDIKKRLGAEAERISMLAKSFAGIPEELDTPDRAALRKRAAETLRKNTMDIISTNYEIQQLTAQIEQSSDGRVHVSGSIYPGVKLLMGSAGYEVERLIEYATFKREGDIVRFTPYEYKGK